MRGIGKEQEVLSFLLHLNFMYEQPQSCDFTLPRKGNTVDISILKFTVEKIRSAYTEHA